MHAVLATQRCSNRLQTRGGQEWFQSTAESPVPEKVNEAVQDYVNLSNDGTLPSLLERRRTVVAQHRASSILKALVETSIAREMGTAESFSAGDEELVRVNTVVQRYFDIEAFRAAHPDIYETFLRQREVRKVLYA